MSAKRMAGIPIFETILSILCIVCLFAPLGYTSGITEDVWKVSKVRNVRNMSTNDIKLSFSIKGFASIEYSSNTTSKCIIKQVLSESLDVRNKEDCDPDDSFRVVWNGSRPFNATGALSVNIERMVTTPMIHGRSNTYAQSGTLSLRNGSNGYSCDWVKGRRECSSSATYAISYSSMEVGGIDSGVLGDVDSGVS